MRIRIAIRVIGSHYGKICKSAGDTNERERERKRARVIVWCRRMLEYEQVWRAAGMKGGKEKN